MKKGRQRSFRLFMIIGLSATIIYLSAVVPTLAEAWVPKSGTPEAGGYGQAVVGTGDRIYVAKCLHAASTPRFWCYDPRTNSWSSLSVTGLPDGAFRSGTSLAWDHKILIYALGGARYDDLDRRLFFCYNIQTNEWVRLADTPHPQGAGNAITWSGYDYRIYAILGSNKHGTMFACYNPITDTWEPKSSPPAGTDDGCSIVWTGGRYLFALRGEYIEDSPIRDFWRYDIETDSWSSMKPIPVEGGVGDGASLLWIGLWMAGEHDYIYALSGGDCWENPGYGFYRYSISRGVWERLPDIPYPIGFYCGNRLGYAAGMIHYWQGTPSTWVGGGIAFCSFSLEGLNSAPALSQGSVSPSSSHYGTAFTFRVVYTDIDGDAPSYVKVHIGAASYPMTMVGGDYTTGALYEYATSTLDVGTHTYYFTASDNRGAKVRLPTIGSYRGPTVTPLPRSPTTLSLLPSSFTLDSEESITLTAMLSSDGIPLADKTISFSVTLGTVDIRSGITDSKGKVSVRYTAPKVDLRASVVITATFAGDDLYQASSASSFATVEAKVPPEVLLPEVPPEVLVPTAITLPVRSIAVRTSLDLPERIWIGEKVEVKVEIVRPELPLEIRLENSKISRVAIRLKEVQENVLVIVEKLERKPPQLPDPPGIVWAYHNVSVHADRIEKGWIDFWVLKEWLVVHGVQKEDITMLKFQDGEWKKMQTAFIKENATHLEFSATIQAFSTFVIVAEPATVEEEAAAGVVIGLVFVIAIVVLLFFGKKRLRSEQGITKDLERDKSVALSSY